MGNNIIEKWENPEVIELSVKDSLLGGYTFDDGDQAPSISS